MALEAHLITDYYEYGTELRQFLEPRGASIDEEGTIWIADTGNKRIKGLRVDGKQIIIEAKKGTPKFGIKEGSQLVIGYESGLVELCGLDCSDIEQITVKKRKTFHFNEIIDACFLDRDVYVLTGRYQISLVHKLLEKEEIIVWKSDDGKYYQFIAAGKDSLYLPAYAKAPRWCDPYWLFRLSLNGNEAKKEELSYKPRNNLRGFDIKNNQAFLFYDEDLLAVNLLTGEADAITINSNKPFEHLSGGVAVGSGGIAVQVFKDQTNQDRTHLAIVVQHHIGRYELKGIQNP